MNFDFAQVNLMYLLQARDLAAEDTELAVTLLDIPERLAVELADLSAQQLAPIALIKAPLVTMRHDAWWWTRLFTAIREKRTAEIDAILEHLPLLTVK